MITVATRKYDQREQNARTPSVLRFPCDVLCTSDIPSIRTISEAELSRVCWRPVPRYLITSLVRGTAMVDLDTAHPLARVAPEKITSLRVLPLLTHFYVRESTDLAPSASWTDWTRRAISLSRPQWMLVSIGRGLLPTSCTSHRFLVVSTNPMDRRGRVVFSRR